MSILVRMLHILLAVAFVMLTYYIVIWVLGLLGIAVPQHILQVIFVIIGLLAIIGAISGQFDSFWRKP